MNKITKIFINVLVFGILTVPLISFSQGQNPSTTTGLVPCTDGKSCDFNALMDLVNNVIEFILKYMALPIAAIMFAYAGLKMITAGGEAAHARTQAKEIFMNTIIGLIIAVAAVLIVKTILSILGYKGAWLGFGVGV